MATLLQWNCRGFRANRSDIDLLIQSYSPVAICLQETLLANITYSIPRYVPYHIFASLDNNNRPHGGVSIFVKSNIPQRKINLDTDIPAVAVSIIHGKKLTLCSIYLNPRYNITLEDLYHLTEQLPKPYILLGDFNAHNTLWGDSSTDQKGGIIEELLNIQQLCLWNDGTPTYLHPATGTKTCIDLSISHSSLHLDYTWQVHEDTCGSDHFPIVLKSCLDIPEEKLQRWQFHKADWVLFSELCLTELNQNNYQSNEDPVNLFTQTLHSIADRTIPKSSPTYSNKCKPWFDEECKQAIKTRNQAYRIFCQYPTPENLTGFRRCQAQTRRLIKSRKRLSWRNYVSGLTSKTPIKKTWDMVRKITGKPCEPQLHHLQINGTIIDDPVDVVNSLGQTIASHSSSASCSGSFL